MSETYGSQGLPQSRPGTGNKVLWIVLGVLVGLILLTMTMCFVYKDELANMAIAATVDAIRVEATADTTLQFDREQYGQLVKNFKEQISAGKHSDTAVLEFMQSIQTIYADSKIELGEIEQSAQAMIRFFPDLAQFWNAESAAQLPLPADSAAGYPVESDSISGSLDSAEVTIDTSEAADTFHGQ